MHTKKFMTNGVLVTISQLLWVALGLLSRRVFVSLLSVEYLGYDNVFSNVLSLLSVADLGMESVIAVRLYEAVTKKDHESTCKLIWIYKWFYRIVAGVVFFGSIILYPFLPYIISRPSASWEYLSVVYFMQVAAVVAGYFLSYKRAVFIANQQNYYCSLADLLMCLVTQVLQILVLLIWQSYLLYLAVKLSASPLANVVLAFMSRKKYPYLTTSIHATRQDIRRFKIVTESKNFLIHKVSSLVFNATGTIIVSAFCGIYTAALYGNYASLYLMATGILLTQPFNALKSAVGNLLHEDISPERQRHLFEAISTAGDWYSLQIMLGFFLFTQPVMELWLGRKFLMPDGLVLAYSLSQGVLVWYYTMYTYRGVLGNFARDRWFQIASVAVNIVISISLVRSLESVAVIIGSIVGCFVSVCGFAVVVYGDFLQCGIGSYLRRRLLLLGTMVLELWLLCHTMDVSPTLSFGALAVRFLIWVAFWFINGVLLRKTAGADELQRIIISFAHSCAAKLKKRRV